MNHQRANAISGAVAAACCVLITGIAAARFLTPPEPDSSAVPTPDWSDLAADGRRIGPADARVTLVAFTDFQCPACARFHRFALKLMEEFSGEIALVYRHFPISSKHAHAAAAAAASECAGAQGRFAEFSELLFARQRQLGQQPWEAFAETASVSDTRAFTDCMRDAAMEKRLREDLHVGYRLRVRGTPTVLVNEWRIVGPPSDSLVRALIGRELSRWSQDARESR